MDEYPYTSQHSETLPTPRTMAKGDPSTTYESLLRKTQKLLAEAQQALEKEKNTYIAQIRSQEKRFEDQTKSLKEENEELRRELAESGLHNSEVALRRTFFERMEELESSAKQTEKSLREQLLQVSSQLAATESELANVRQNHAVEKTQLTIALEDAKRQNEYLSRQLTKSVGELKSKLLRTAQQLAKYSQMSKQDKALYKEKLEVLMKHVNESEELWFREKQELVSSVVKAEQTQAEKDEAVAEQLSLLKAEKDSILETVRGQVHSLIREKEAASLVLEESLVTHNERETAMEQEIVRLQTSLGRVIAYSQTREEKLQAELKRLGEEFKQLRESQSTREESVMGFAGDFGAALGRYTECLSQWREKCQQSNTPSEEATHLKGLLDNKEKELISLREMYVTTKQSERLHASKSLSAIQTLSADFKREHGRIVEEANDALREFTASIDACVQGLPEVASAFPAVLAQLHSAREESESLKMDLARTDMELEQAHATIASLMDSLEKYERSGADDSDTRADSLERELMQLRQTKIQREKRFEEDLAKLRETVGEKQAAIDDLQFQLTKARALANVKFSEESRTLHKKWEVLLKAAQRMENCLADLKSGLHHGKKVKDMKRKAEAEELSLLRSEVKKNEQMHAELQAIWSASKSLLEAQLESQRVSLLSLKAQNAEISALLAAQHSLLTQQTTQIQQLTAACNPTPDVHITTLSAPNELVAALQHEAAVLREQVKKMTEGHAVELAEVKRFYEEEERSKKVVGYSVSREVQMQAEKLQQLTLMLESERELHQHELSQMRQEVSRLRSHCLQRYELLHSDRQEVMSELRSLLTSATTSETASQKSLYQGIKKMKELIDTVKGDRRQTDRLQNLQEELVNFRGIEEQRAKAQETEREALNALILKLKDAYAALSRTAANEREDHALEVRVLEGRLDGLEKECALLRKQRDEVLLHLGKSSETAANEVAGLVQQLRTDDKQRSLQPQSSRAKLQKKCGN